MNDDNEIVLRKVQGGFAPETERDAEAIRRFKLGAPVRCKLTAINDPIMHRRLFALFRVAYEYFQERVDGGLMYRGQLVKPSFNRFRKDLTIAAGFYTATYALNGEVRVEAKPLKYSNCTDEEKAEIYQRVIDAAIKHVYENKRNEAWLKEAVERILSFA